MRKMDLESGPLVSAEPFVLPRTMLDSLDPRQRDLWAAESATPAFVGDGEDRTRQEFKDECDVNHVLTMYGAGRGPRGGPGQFGVEVDDRVDLQESYAHMASLADAYRRAPAALRKAYPTFESMLRALAVDAIDASLWREEAASAAAKPAESAGAPSAPAADGAGAR